MFTSLGGEFNKSEHPLLKRFIKGVFNLRPPKPRYSQIWDIGCVLTYLRSLGDTQLLPLKLLTYKLVTLLMLLSASRVNYISSLSIDNMVLTNDSCTFFPTKLLKHSRPSFLGNPLRFRAYPLDSHLCVIATLHEYVSRRNQLTASTCTQLLISHVKPHHPVHKDTVARWLKEVLDNSGIDSSIFTAHSFRSANSAHSSKVPIGEILKQGQWTTEKTWYNYYHKEIVSSQSTTFADGVLQN